MKGLCQNCMHKGSCTLSQGKEPVMFCEEFECQPGKKNPAARKTVTEKYGDITRFKGLCVNCDFRDECTNADLQGGVWYCENYSCAGNAA